MTEPVTVRRSAYRWERETFPDLEIPLDFLMMKMWATRLTLEFELKNVAFSYRTASDPAAAGLKGTAKVGFSPWGEKRAIISIFPPYHLRTLGHEVAHAMRWIRGEKSGHGDGWREDLAMVHGVIRRLIPKLHHSKLNQADIGRRCIEWNPYRLNRRMSCPS